MLSFSFGVPSNLLQQKSPTGGGGWQMLMLADEGGGGGRKSAKFCWHSLWKPPNCISKKKFHSPIDCVPRSKTFFRCFEIILKLVYKVTVKKSGNFIIKDSLLGSGIWQAQSSAERGFRWKCRSYDPTFIGVYSGGLLFRYLELRLQEMNLYRKRKYKRFRET